MAIQTTDEFLRTFLTASEYQWVKGKKNGIFKHLAKKRYLSQRKGRSPFKITLSKKVASAVKNWD